MNAGWVVRHAHLLRRVCGSGHAGSSGRVRTAVKNLRDKLGYATQNPTYIFNPAPRRIQDAERGEISRQ